MKLRRAGEQGRGELHQEHSLPGAGASVLPKQPQHRRAEEDATRSVRMEKEKWSDG